MQLGYYSTQERFTDGFLINGLKPLPLVVVI